MGRNADRNQKTLVKMSIEVQTLITTIINPTTDFSIVVYYMVREVRFQYLKPDHLVYTGNPNDNMWL